MKYIALLLFIFSVILFGWVCYNLGYESVPKCQETGLTLVSSHVRKDGVTCVYVEPWKIKGKLKRIENALQKKTT